MSRAPHPETPIIDESGVYLGPSDQDLSAYAPPNDDKCKMSLERILPFIKQLPADCMGIHEPQHEGSTGWYYRDEWIAEAERAIATPSPSGEATAGEVAKELALWCYIETVERPAMGQGPTAVLNIKKATAIIATALNAARREGVVAGLEAAKTLARSLWKTTAVNGNPQQKCVKYIDSVHDRICALSPDTILYAIVVTGECK